MKKPQELQKDKSKKNTTGNKQFLICTGSLVQPALFKEIQATNYKILVSTGTGMQDSLLFIQINSD